MQLPPSPRQTRSARLAHRRWSRPLMNALSQTSRVVTHAARQKRIFWACVRQPAKDVRQDGPAAPAGETNVATMSSARASMRRSPSTDNIGTSARDLEPRVLRPERARWRRSWFQRPATPYFPVACAGPTQTELSPRGASRRARIANPMPIAASTRHPYCATVSPRYRAWAPGRSVWRRKSPRKRAGAYSSATRRSGSSRSRATSPTTVSVTATNPRTSKGRPSAPTTVSSSSGTSAAARPRAHLHDHLLRDGCQLQRDGAAGDRHGTTRLTDERGTAAAHRSRRRPHAPSAISLPPPPRRMPPSVPPVPSRTPPSARTAPCTRPAPAAPPADRYAAGSSGPTS